MQNTVSGFSRLSKQEKIDWLVQQYCPGDQEAVHTLQQFWQDDPQLQRVLDSFSENTISNFFMPFGIAPNFLINGSVYAVPMVIEESSVVAAAASAAKFWLSRGGFHTTVLSTRKLGQLHFSWAGDLDKLRRVFPELQQYLRHEAAPITANMEKRGGGILDIELVDLSDLEPDYYQLLVSFETCDSMGANFINSVLESFGHSLRTFVATHEAFSGTEQELNVIMAILSNYTPECIVRAAVQCEVEALAGACGDLSATAFAEKFSKAIRIARLDPYRATTHNKGIFNGVDAVVLATGNDFRAIEACGHTHACHDGQYRSLSNCEIKDGIFHFWLDLPLAVGTVGGLTKLHPLAKLSLQVLGNPGAAELMSIIAATGLAQNFAAVRSLVTTGIQQGHMKMHLLNILNHLGATETEIRQVQTYFAERVVSVTAVRDYLLQQRKQQNVS